MDWEYELKGLAGSIWAHAPNDDTATSAEKENQSGKGLNSKGKRPRDILSDARQKIFRLAGDTAG